MKPKIPKEVTLYGQKIKVVIDRKTNSEDHGICNARLNTITIFENVTGDKQCKDSMEQAYCHELLHMTLYLAGYHDLDKNESFVERISQLQHQSRKTEVY